MPHLHRVPVSSTPRNTRPAGAAPSVTSVILTHLSALTLLLLPDRVLDDLGSAFSMGCVGSFVWYAVKGAKNSPRGARVRGAYGNIVLRSPTLGGNFAVWGGLFSSYDCCLNKLRGKEDPINAIAAGALTGGTLAARAGMKAIAKNGLIGGVLLAIIEGLGMALSRMTQPESQHQQQINILASTMQQQQQAAAGGRGGVMDSGIGGIGGLLGDASPVSGGRLPVNGASLLLMAPDDEFSSDDFSFDDGADMLDDD
jgi:import inner membrane translocase subunit TIM17